MSIKRTLGRLALIATACGAMAVAHAETTIAYITNGNTNEGWTLINGGAADAAKKAGVKFIQLAAEKGALSSQLAIVEDMITRKVNAIAIAPVDSAGIAPAITKAMNAVASQNSPATGQRLCVCGFNV